LDDSDERLRCLYRSIEDGIIELDEILRKRAKAALARAPCGTVASIDAAKIDAFAWLVTEKVDRRTPARPRARGACRHKAALPTLHQ
jgi:site-specific DNA recombinase